MPAIGLDPKFVHIGTKNQSKCCRKLTMGKCGHFTIVMNGKLGLTATAIVCMEIEKKNQIPSLQWPRVLHKCFWPAGFIFNFDPF